MCGIIAIARRRSSRPAPSRSEVLGLVKAAEAVLVGPCSDRVAWLDELAAPLAELDRLLRGAPGAVALLRDRALIASLEASLIALADRLPALDAELDAAAPSAGVAELEQRSAALIRLKDVVWALQKDRLRTVRELDLLAGADAAPATIDAYLSIQEALSALDRLEVRGRDSAGLHVLVSGHGLDLATPAVQALLGERGADPLFGAGAVRVAEHGSLSFVYKAAAEIGELGDNTRALRTAIRNDELLRLAVAGSDAVALVVGHTRWASVGIISIPNAHPLNSDEVGRTAGPYVIGALNGDVDNFADLKAAEELRIRPEITTDAKVIPTLVSRRLGAGAELVEAFRQTVASFEGSVAIAAAAASAPERLLLALRGSGQALYVGCDEDVYVVASEPYGVVEVCGRYLRMDGDTAADADHAAASRGQIVVLDTRRAGELAGVSRMAYDGRPLPVEEQELARPQITTRDIDRGTFPHYLLKEITESPSSFRKTLRGKLVDRAGRLEVELGPETLPDSLRADLADGRITQVLVIGQGTAAVAGHGLAAALRDCVAHSRLRVEAVRASELSGFDLRADMSDTLVVAISQSGTTTDTNRTVDLARSRGARVVAIVNRRNSDLTDRAEGVLYTSDGRDVEMSVASTKAFYSQIAAGFLLADAVAGLVGRTVAEAERQTLLGALRDLPDAMAATLELRPLIADAAHRFAPGRRYWAVVGNGRNRIAAEEVRIKLSELCYKSIACDATEDKKHIDLSSEPLILVCASGLSGSTADDVAKEIGIYRAHRALPIVVASDGEHRFDAGVAVLTVPAVHPELDFVLSAMVGHVFGYEAALAIDTCAVPLREARAAVEQTISESFGGVGHDDLLARLKPRLEPAVERFFDGLRAGHFNGHLEAATAVRVASLLRYATKTLPLEAYQVEYGKVGTPAVVVEDLTRALTQGVDELTRPVDAIKHQAKTVTVGISRSDETLLAAALVREVLAAGSARDRLSYDSLRTLAALDPAVAAVDGFTRYDITWSGRNGEGQIVVVDRGGISLDLPLRTERNPQLRGTKHRVAIERRVLVARGRSDGRLLVIVPEVKANVCTGITLLHVRFQERLAAPAMRTALVGYRNRYESLKDAVTETEPAFRDDLLERMPVADLLIEPIERLADRWRS
ncbi:MAG: SIS domain-containing protein [Acidimicrobiales bacterium]